ncbi:MAG: TonB-dependent receptor [Sphingobacteriales bacterium]|nr:TonB-dependent receptor [Sphingobacteriales bacterium]MCC7057032.1 TonB-dependent receptor [Chitinophagales bacterium]
MCKCFCSIFYFLFLLSFTVLLSCFGSTTSAWAQCSISGYVLSAADGAPLANATVHTTKRHTTTNEKGFFKLDGLMWGEIFIEITYVGYTPYRNRVLCGQTNTNNNEPLTLNIKLQPANNLIKTEVVVTATRVGTNAASTYQNISGETLRQENAGRDLPYLLQQTPSAVATSDAGTGIGYTGLRLRGTDATRINVTVNGFPLNDAESHQVYWVDLPDITNSVENVQIQRGVGSSSNGAGAFGASINLQTNTYQPLAYTDLEAGYGSFNSQRAALRFGTGLLGNHFTLDGRATYQYSDGYIDRAFARLNSMTLMANWQNKRNSWRANFIRGHEVTYQAWEGVPEALLKTQPTFNSYTYDNQVDDYGQNHLQLFYTRQLPQNWSLQIGLNRTQGKGYYEQYKTDQVFGDYGLYPDTLWQVLKNPDGLAIDTLPITNTDLVRRKWLDNSSYGAVASARYEKQGKTFTLSSTAHWYNGQHYGTLEWAEYMPNGILRQRYYDGTGKKLDANIFAKFEYAFFNKWWLFADLQYRMIDYQIKGTDDEKGSLALSKKWNFVNPKLGLTYILTTNKQLYASFGVAHREPTRSNLVDNDTLPTHEQLQNLEMGYRYKGKTVQFTANYFLMLYHNQLVLTGNLNSVGAPIQQNVPNSYRTGLELQADCEINNRLSLQANIAFSLHKIRQFNVTAPIYTDADTWGYLRDTLLTYKNTDISFSPTQVSGLTLKWQPVNGLNLEWQHKYIGAQYLDNTMNNDRKLQAYYTQDILASWQFEKIPNIRKIAFTIQLINLLNTKYRSNGYTYFALFQGSSPQLNTITQNFNFYYPQAERHVLGGIKISF